MAVLVNPGNATNTEPPWPKHPYIDAFCATSGAGIKSPAHVSAGLVGNVPEFELGLVTRESPILNAFCRVAPSERFKAEAMCCCRTRPLT